MRTPTDSLADTFQSLDPSLAPQVFHTAEQQALRVVTAIILAAYALLLPATIPGPDWLPLLVASTYALIQAGLGWVEAVRGPRPWLSQLIGAFDLLLLALALAIDPLSGVPTLLLVAVFAGLASLRLNRKQQILHLGIMLLIASATLGLRQLFGDTQPWPPLLAAAGGLLLLLGTILVLHQHHRQLRLLTQQTVADDTDTGLGNRWTLYATARLLWPYAHRHQLPITLMYAEITPEDSRLVSDPEQVRLLAREFSLLAQQRLRGSDVMVRYSALSFVFVLIDCISSDADPIALHMQEQFHRWSKDQGTPVTAHIGVTWLPQEPMALDQLLISMHEGLQRARRYRFGAAGAVHIDPEHARQGAQLS